METKIYNSPEIAIVEVESEGVLCASVQNNSFKYYSQEENI